MDERKKHVYDHKRRVKLYQDMEALSDENLTPNEEALLKIIEDMKQRISDLENQQE